MGADRSGIEFPSQIALCSNNSKSTVFHLVFSGGKLAEFQGRGIFFVQIPIFFAP